MIAREDQQWIVRCDICQAQQANLGGAAQLQNAPTYQEETERLGPLTGRIVCNGHAFDHATGEWMPAKV